MANDFIPHRPSSHRVVLTGDGTCSLYSQEYAECMHSESGAYEEALHKHVLPSGVLDLVAEEIRVLDVGCGIGYNILALISELRKRKNTGGIRVITLEREFSFVPLMECISFNDDRDIIYAWIKNAVSAGEFSSPSCSIVLRRGDAREAVQTLESSTIDAVFHDPFSPAKNPELWTVDFFKHIHRVIRPSGVITTYSSAQHIRMALMEAGFTIGKGPSVGKKREGTVATISGPIQKLPEEEIKTLRRSVSSVPYRDSSLGDSRGTILERRKEEMRLKRGRPAP